MNNDAAEKCPLCGDNTADGVCPSCGYFYPADEIERMTHIMDGVPDDQTALRVKRIPIVKIFRERDVSSDRKGESRDFFPGAEIYHEKTAAEKAFVKAGVIFRAFLGTVAGVIIPFVPASVILGWIVFSLSKVCGRGTDTSSAVFGIAMIAGAVLRLFIGMFLMTR